MKFNRIFLIAATALSVVACNKNKGELRPSETSPINVTAGLDVDTRAGYDAENLPMHFYLTIVQDADNQGSEYNYTEVEMTKGESGRYNAFDADLFWMNDNHSDVKVNAYTAKGTAFSVLKDQSTEAKLEQSDLLGAYEGHSDDITFNANDLYVRFRHLLCKLDVTVAWDEALAGLAKEVTSVVYKGFGEDVVLNRNDATVTAGENVIDIQAFLKSTDENKTYVSEAVFAPQTADMAIVISARIDGVEKGYQLNLEPPTDGFVFGNAYTLGVKICGDALLFMATPTLNAWENGDPLDFSKAEAIFTFVASTDSPME